MKRNIFFILTLLFAEMTMAQGIKFEEGNLQAVLDKAKKEKKMVFIDGYATWCGPCKWMEKNVFPDEQIGKYFDENVVAMSVDVERGEGPAIRTRYAIDGLPGYIFMDSEGTVIHRNSGRMSKENFLEMAKKAMTLMNDPNSVGSMAMQYETRKDDETFVRNYLDRLKESGSAGYYDVVEHYLNIQTTMKPVSAEMVNFLYKHIKSLVFGGKADEIMSEHLWTYPWDAYVRKNIRKEFQNLPKLLAAQTTEYAILKRDTTMLDMAMERVKAYGETPAEGQRERLLIYYYSQTGEGEKYKVLYKKGIEEYFNAKLDVKELREKLIIKQKKQQENPSAKFRSYAEINTEKFRFMLSEYGRFLTEKDYADMLRWATRLHEVYPEDVNNEVFYARALYVCGGDRQQAIAIVEESLNDNSLGKKAEGLKKDYELMKAGKDIPLLY